MMSKDLTGVVDAVYGNSRFFGRFQDGCEKYLNSNQLTSVIVDRRPLTKESNVPTISMNLEEKFYLEKV